MPVREFMPLPYLECVPSNSGQHGQSKEIWKLSKQRMLFEMFTQQEFATQ